MSSVNGSPSPVKFTSAEKRAVHNALERKRRDHIKDMFSQLKDSVPNLAGEKVSVKASRAQILKKACDYIQLMRRKNQGTAKDLDALNQQISRTRKQIAKLDSVRNTNRYVAALPQPPTPSIYHVPAVVTSLSSPASHPVENLQPSAIPPVPLSHSISLPVPAMTMVPTLPPRIPNPAGHPYRMALASMSLENYNLMSNRLPSMHSLPRFYVADVPMHNINRSTPPENRAPTPTGPV